MGIMEFTNPQGLNPPVSAVGTGDVGALDIGLDTSEGTPYSGDPINMQYPGDYGTGLDYSDNGIKGYDKYLKPQLPQEIIGIQNPRLVISDTAWTPTQTTFDTTTYNDRAVVKLRNEAGSTKTLHAFAIGGQLVVRVSGKNGYVWEAANYDDIEINGELEYKIGNEFMVNTTQIESIGDYLQKELRPHDMYKLVLRGRHPYFEVGDRYTLDITHSISGGSSEAEEIDIDVEICGWNVVGEVGQIGSTVLTVRVPTGAWSKTTTTRARMLTAGLPFGSLTRGNVIKVAASTYTGTDAHFYCDGTDDQVQIHAALTHLGKIGGGTLELTRGIFNVTYSIYGLEDACITINANDENISIVGEGMENTIIRHDCIADDYRYIIAILSTNVNIYNLAIEATGTYISKSYGILIGADTDNARITYSKITAARCIADGYGTNSGLSVIECIGVVKNADITARFISLEDCSNAVISKNIITVDDIAVGADIFNAIWINGVCYGASIEGNQIILNGSDSASSSVGIFITSSSASNFNINNNIIRFNGSYTARVAGITITGSDGIISSNIIVGTDFVNNSDSYGIVVSGDRNSITGNNVRSVTNTGAGTGYGIYISATADRTNVSGNTALSCDTNYTDAGTNTSATGNVTS